MSPLMQDALLGGLISLAATSVGAAMAPIFSGSKYIRDLRAAVDVALGVMLSAVAFSLVGPNLVEAIRHPADHPAGISLVLSGFLSGFVFLWVAHALVDRAMHRNTGHLDRAGAKNSARWMFAAAIILHNFPEGMGAGSSMAGTPLAEAVVVQLGLSVQNIAEGALLVLCFQSLGWSVPAALAGSFFSGVVELTGAFTGGAALEWTLASLPFTLALAGGAMLMSVVLEHKERAREGAPVAAWRLAAGLIAIPLLNIFLP